MASCAYIIDFIGLYWASQHLEHPPILIRDCYAKIGVDRRRRGEWRNIDSFRVRGYAGAYQGRKYEYCDGRQELSYEFSQHSLPADFSRTAGIGGTG
mgnify:CR=1 FL=1